MLVGLFFVLKVDRKFVSQLYFNLEGPFDNIEIIFEKEEVGRSDLLARTHFVLQIQL